MNPTQHVAVIGGGAIGLSAAYYLKREGVSVTVIDKGPIGHGCSLHNAGYVCPSHFVPLAHPGVITQGLKWLRDPESPFYIKPRLSVELASWVWRFYRASTTEHVHKTMTLLRDLCTESLTLYQDLARVDGMHFELQEKGLCVLFKTEKAERSMRHEAELAARLNVEAQILDPAQLSKLSPGVKFDVRGGLFYPGDAHISPSRFVESMHRHLESLGVTVLTGTEVTALETSGGRITRLLTSRGAVEADEFILGAGSWSPGLVRSLGVSLPVQPGKGYSVTVERPEHTPSVPFILTEARVAITPFTDGLRFAGTMELAGLNLSINRRRVEAILKAVPRYLPDVDTSRAWSAEVWAGLRPCSPDGMPFIGRFKRWKNLIAATGHAMIGITLATVTGKLAMEVAMGRTPSHDLRLVSPERFS